MIIVIFVHDNNRMAKYQYRPSLLDRLPQSYDKGFIETAETHLDLSLVCDVYNE